MTDSEQTTGQWRPRYGYFDPCGLFEGGTDPRDSSMTNSSEESTADAGASFTDPEFATMPLEISVDEAIDEVHDAVKGLHGTPTPVGVKVRTTDGMLVAVVRESERDDDAVSSRLSYRIEPASELATRKAQKIATALERFTTPAETVPSG